MNDENRHMEERSPQLDNIGRGMPYAVPGGYFDELASRTLAAVRAEETAGKLPTTMPYAAPEGYFESLAGRVLQQTAVPQPKKGFVISFPAMRWAAAAMVILMAGLGGYELQQRMPAEGGETQFLASVNDAEIEAYLGGDVAARTATTADAHYLDGLDVKNKDIEKYLDETGWSIE